MRDVRSIVKASAVPRFSAPLSEKSCVDVSDDTAARPSAVAALSSVPRSEELDVAWPARLGTNGRMDIICGPR